MRWHCAVTYFAQFHTLLWYGATVHTVLRGHVTIASDASANVLTSFHRLYLMHCWSVENDAQVRLTPVSSNDIMVTSSGRILFSPRNERTVLLRLLVNRAVRSLRDHTQCYPTIVHTSIWDLNFTFNYNDKYIRYEMWLKYFPVISSLNSTIFLIFIEIIEISGSCKGIIGLHQLYSQIPTWIICSRICECSNYALLYRYIHELSNWAFYRFVSLNFVVVSYVNAFILFHCNSAIFSALCRFQILSSNIVLFIVRRVSLLECISLSNVVFSFFFGKWRVKNIVQNEVELWPHIKYI